MRTALKITLFLLLGTHFTAFSDTYTLNKAHNVIGEVKTIRAHREDTFIKIAHQFDLGYEELIRANPGVDPWLPAEGSQIVLPTRFILPEDKSEGIHINLSEYRLYYFYDQNKVMTFPISIGREEWQTPVGRVTVEDKIINPNWYPTPEIRHEHQLNGDPLPAVVLPGSNNPLGKFALKLNLPGYFIHGTNKPYGIGMKVTHGCIRLRPNDIALLFDDITRKTLVKIYHEPYKSTVEGNSIYFEANTAITMSDRDYADALTQSIQKIIEAAVQSDKSLNWDLIGIMIQQKEGIPKEVNLDANNTQWAEVAMPTTATKIKNSAAKITSLF